MHLVISEIRMSKYRMSKYRIFRTLNICSRLYNSWTISLKVNHKSNKKESEQTKQQVVY